MCPNFHSSFQGSEIGTLKSDIANRLGLNGEIRVLGPGDAGANTIGSDVARLEKPTLIVEQWLGSI